MQVNLMNSTSNYNNSKKNLSFGMKFSSNAKKQLLDFANNGYIEERSRDILFRLARNDDNMVLKSLEPKLEMEPVGTMIHSWFEGHASLMEAGKPSPIKIYGGKNIEETVYNLLSHLKEKVIPAKINLADEIANLPEG